jgi:3-hydroxyisobutyrate dehydrogenase-like beta-hydroxyacid dehydrogenase
MTGARTTSSGPTTVGVLYAGELGASVGALLRGRGVRMVTTVAGRGAATVARAREAGMVVLNGITDVVRQSDVVISLVPPAAAEEVAATYCEHARLAPAGALYVDANSVGPELIERMAANVERCGRGFVDAAINGLAKNLATSGTLFLSGGRAEEVAGLFEGAMRVRVLGDEAGRASAMKMLLSGVSKGVCALVAELAMVAERRQMLPEMIEAMREIYPGIWALAERMLPTYPKHAGRRAGEMQELEETCQAVGLEPGVVAAVRGMHEMLAKVPFGEAPDTGGWTVASVVRQLAELGQLTAEPRAAEETHTAK